MRLCARQMRGRPAHSSRPLWPSLTSRGSNRFRARLRRQARSQVTGRLCPASAPVPVCSEAFGQGTVAVDDRGDSAAASSSWELARRSRFCLPWRCRLSRRRAPTATMPVAMRYFMACSITSYVSTKVLGCASRGRGADDASFSEAAAANACGVIRWSARPSRKTPATLWQVSWHFSGLHRCLALQHGLENEGWRWGPQRVNASPASTHRAMQEA